jgi:predicted solute-binding protein
LAALTTRLEAAARIAGHNGATACMGKRAHMALRADVFKARSLSLLMPKMHARAICDERVTDMHVAEHAPDACAAAHCRALFFFSRGLVRRQHIWERWSGAVPLPVSLCGAALPAVQMQSMCTCCARAMHRSYA